MSCKNLIKINEWKNLSDRYKLPEHPKNSWISFNANVTFIMWINKGLSCNSRKKKERETFTT